MGAARVVQPDHLLRRHRRVRQLEPVEAVLEGAVQLVGGGVLRGHVLAPEPHLRLPVLEHGVELAAREGRQPAQPLLGAAEALLRKLGLETRQRERLAAALLRLLLRLQLRLERLRLLGRRRTCAKGRGEGRGGGRAGERESGGGAAPAGGRAGRRLGVRSGGRSARARAGAGAADAPRRRPPARCARTAARTGLPLAFGARSYRTLASGCSAGVAEPLDAVGVGARGEELAAHVVVPLLELLHRARRRALGEAVVDHGPAQVEAAAELEEEVRLRLLPRRVGEVLRVLVVVVREHLHLLVEPRERVVRRLVVVLLPVPELEPILHLRVRRARVVEAPPLPSDDVRSFALKASSARPSARAARRCSASPPRSANTSAHPFGFLIDGCFARAGPERRCARCPGCL